MKLLAKRAEDRYQTAAGLERIRRDRWRRRRDSCPASRGSHTVSTPCRFLESTAAVDRLPQRILAMYRCRASTAPGVEYPSGLRLRYSNVAWLRVRPERTCRYRIPRGGTNPQ